jgi:hypothetical protein
MSNDRPSFRVTNPNATPSDDAIAALARLLTSSTNECELCGDGPQEHYLDSGEWAGRHCCRRCFESLPTNQEDQTDATS